MSKDITKNILLKAGFIESIDDTFKFFIETGGYITLHYVQPPFGRCWQCYADNTINMCNADIQTIDHFNKLMEIMEIDFKLNE